MAGSSLVSWISEPLPLQHYEFASSFQFSLSETSSSSASVDHHSVLPEWIGADPFYLPQASLTQSGAQNLGGLTGRVVKRKRKSRASKGNLTTYISTDTANFRQMVQQVTGVGIEENGNLEAEQPGSVRPELKRATTLTEQPNYVLPTLDTSAFLLERNIQNESVLPIAGPGRNPGFQMDQFSFFPTLDSWSVM